jgi:hypothetical protein
MPSNKFNTLACHGGKPVIAAPDAAAEFDPRHSPFHLDPHHRGQYVARRRTNVSS